MKPSSGGPLCLTDCQGCLLAWRERNRASSLVCNRHPCCCAAGSRHTDLAKVHKVELQQPPWQPSIDAPLERALYRRMTSCTCLPQPRMSCHLSTQIIKLSCNYLESDSLISLQAKCIGLPRNALTETCQQTLNDDSKQIDEHAITGRLRV